MSCNVEKMSPADCHQEKKQNPHQLHPPQSNPWENYLRKVPRSRVDREPLLGETHTVNHYKSQQSECLDTQGTEGMPNCCPDMLLQVQGPWVTSTHQWCGTPISSLWNPHWRWCNDTQPATFFMTSAPLFFKCLCHGGSTPVGKNCSQGEDQTRSAWRTKSLTDLLM